MIKKYKLISQIVEAVQYEGEPEGLMTFGATGFGYNRTGDYSTISVSLPNRVGSQHIHLGDYLLKDAHGDYHIMKEEIFNRYFKEYS